MKPNLTLAEARDLPFEDLIERTEAILAAYDKPDVETPGQRVARLSRSLDETPQVYRWFLQLSSWCGHWVGASSEMFGARARETQALRQRRDLFDSQASAAKLRHASASRMITVDLEFQPDGMPRHRKGSE